MRPIGLAIVLLAASAVAAAQTAAGSTQAAPPQQAATVNAPGIDSKAATPAAADLSAEQQRLLDEADQLLDLAQKLKTEVDKTNQYTLSVKTLRRADDIEKLAKTLEKQVERDSH